MPIIRLPIMYVYYSCYIAHAMFPPHIKICTENPTFVLSFIYMCDIISPPAPFKICYLARNLKELHEPAIDSGGNVSDLVLARNTPLHGLPYMVMPMMF